MGDWVLMGLGLVTVAAGAGMVLSRHPIHAALFLVLALLNVGGIYALLSAHLLAAIQIIVYVGAIMTFILYSILLMDIRERDLGEGGSPVKWIALAVGLVWMVTVLGLSAGLEAGPLPVAPADFGGVKPVARELFTRYLLLFELVSVLLLGAIVGAVALALGGRETAATGGKDAA